MIEGIAPRQRRDLPPVPMPALVEGQLKHLLEAAKLFRSGRKTQEIGMLERSSCAMTTAPWRSFLVFQGQITVRRARLEPRRAP